MKYSFGISKKVIAACLVLSIFLSAAICYLSYKSYELSLIDRYTSVASNAVDLGRDIVNGDKLSYYLTSLQKDENYNETQDLLNKIKEHSDLKYFYVHIPNGENMQYIFDAYKKSDNIENISTLGETDLLLSAYDPVNKVYNGESSCEIMILDEEYGYLATVIKPVYDSHGKIVAIIGADISMDLVHQKLYEYILQVFTLTIIIVLIFITVVLILAKRLIISPLLTVSDSVSKFVKDKKSLNFSPIKIKSGDEIEILGNSINNMVDDIVRYTNDLKTITAEKERISTELEVAKHIQSSVLPNIFPPFPNRDDINLYAMMRPAKEVGGDFYDFFLIDDGHLAITIADVSGKGVPAALFMMAAKTMIKNAGLAKMSPDEIFYHVNNQLYENNQESMFVTSFMGIVNLKTGDLTFANAGHNPPVIIRKDKSVEWMESKNNFVLAGMKNMKFMKQHFKLNRGDTILLYTDGVTETENKEKQLYSNERLIDFLKNIPDTYQNPNVLLKEILKDVDNFANGAQQSDDITMLALLID